MSFNWKQLLASIAPMLGTALGGPLGGAAAGSVVAALGLDGKVDPKDPKAVEDALAQALMKPEDVVKLRQAEMDFKRAMAELEIRSVTDLERIASEDRNSARNREVQLRDWTPRALAGVVVLGFLWAVWYVLSGRVQGLRDATTIGMIGTLVGYLSAKADTVIGYYFGSSAGSDRKTDLLGGK